MNQLTINRGINNFDSYRKYFGHAKQKATDSNYSLYFNIIYIKKNGSIEIENGGIYCPWDNIYE